MDKARRKSELPTQQSRNPNISTEKRPGGAARRSRGTLDREARRDPLSGGCAPDYHDPDAMTRKGEEDDTRAGRDGAGRSNARDGRY
ncbi:hypothetical protein HT136_04395 [Novosphingobium profundi]|uniref:hypothetical protein n=1 Tax=Novosphingobium profundi TaxID=1774954 RepID=UPI001BDAE64A|nr:hypothetical protein [Novosphingobium profundi]MBT0667605.1 hypothetical protein [Novosphingobium profundi]